MTDEAYEETLKTLRADREQVADLVGSLTSQLEQAKNRLLNLDATIKTLSALLENAPPEEKLAKQCRKILERAKGRPFTPIQMRAELARVGYNLDQHSNPLASIHSVLKRIADMPNFEQLGNGVYRWRFLPKAAK
jgi:phage shock protein A